MPKVNVRIANMAAKEPCVMLHATYDSRMETISTNRVDVKWKLGEVLTISRDTVLKLIRERYKIDQKLALMVKYSLPDRGMTDYATFPKELEILEAASDEDGKVKSEGSHNIYIKV